MKKFFAVLVVFLALLGGYFFGFIHQSKASTTETSVIYCQPPTGNSTCYDDLYSASGGGFWDIGIEADVTTYSSYFATNYSDVWMKSLDSGSPYLRDIYADSHDTAALHYGREYYGIQMTSSSDFYIYMNNDKFYGSNRKVVFSIMNDFTAAAAGYGVVEVGEMFMDQ